MIQILENEKTIHLKTKHTSLILNVLESGHLTCLYFGKAIQGNEFSYVIKDIKRASYLSDTDGIKDFKLEQMPLSYPGYGNPDMRTPSFMFEYADGSRISDLRFQGYRIYKEKKKLEGLPSVLHKESEVIELSLYDCVKQIEVILIFSVFENYDAFTQSIKVINHSSENINIYKIMSASWSFLDNQFQCLTLTGAWGRECHISKNNIQQGTFVLDSKRGASGHGQNPFIALMSLDCDENHGDVYAMNFVYSGNFEASIEVDMHQNTRMMMGINSFDFRWELKSQEYFIAPEVVLIHSYQGLNKMTSLFHKFYQDCLIPQQFSHEIRPVLANNWEATYFDFNYKKLIDLADEASKVGIELFVLDDGWFGERHSDESSLGDWIVNEKKIGGSLEMLSNAIHDKGMKFGLWFEPEMVSPNSQLYLKHPDWIICVPQRIPQQARHQYVLDLSRQEVQDYIIESVSNILKSAQIEYIKWDMNRNITDLGSLYLSKYNQKELSHRYILGLYKILDSLTNSFPNVLFEGCAGGGGRFDPGILYYMPQIWTSDDTDAIERLEIQKGTSLIYPPIVMGCHVSASPNHQVGRITSLKTRGVVAMQGNLGYELDFMSLSKSDKQIINNQIETYKKIRKTIQLGNFLRLDQYDNAWMHISQDGNEIVVSYVQVLAKANTVPKRLKLKGLEEQAYYQIQDTNIIRTGSQFMNIGLDIEKVTEDFYSNQWVLYKVKVMCE